MKDIKAFLPRVNCKIATNKLRELFQEIDTRNRNELGFDDFVALYHKLIFDQSVSFLFIHISNIRIFSVIYYFFIFIESYRLE